MAMENKKKANPGPTKQASKDACAIYKWSEHIQTRLEARWDGLDQDY